VIVVNVALVISTSIYDKLSGVGNVGSIVGTAISGSFLFIVGLANSIILYKILRHRRRQARRKLDSEQETIEAIAPKQGMLMMRLLGPLVNFVNRPWKMYPVGVLFGLGFDTASSIALLAISALAKGGENHTRIPPSEVIILPVLFTTGMSLVDSLDSILMLYSYTEFADHSWRIFERSSSGSGGGDARSVDVRCEEKGAEGPAGEVVVEEVCQTADDARQDDNSGAKQMLVRRSTLSQLSIVLTMMSILLAFSISLIEIMGLIGQYCGECSAAASAPDGGGFAGKWWRAWGKANDDYGYIGAGIVGVFLAVVLIWYGGRWIYALFCRVI